MGRRLQSQEDIAGAYLDFTVLERQRSEFETGFFDRPSPTVTAE